MQDLQNLELLASVDSNVEDDYLGADINIESLNLLRDTRDFVDLVNLSDENINSSTINNDMKRESTLLSQR